METRPLEMGNAHAAVVIGGGFYGCMLADALCQRPGQVVLLEKHADLMQRASYANQARVHNGYHYPRSFLTALRSRQSFPRFVETFRDCIDDSFEKYYAVAGPFSKVTARHFRNLCERIGAPLKAAPARIRKLFDPDLIDAVYRVEEYAFDAARLKQAMWDRLRSRGVDVRLQTEALRVERSEHGRLHVGCLGPHGRTTLNAAHVYNCGYSQINRLLVDSGLPVIPLKHEVAELALVRMPEPLDRIGVTVMCGPFFSFMPFPARGLHSFSHVRYTPHTSWTDGGDVQLDGHRYLAELPKTTHFPLMLRDACRFMPALRDCEYVDSLWEIKTVLPASERDDSRPILLRHDVGLPNLTCVLAAKIDNVFDVLDLLDEAGSRVERRAA